ncbi:MAG: ribonuclease, partial [Phycisphaerales bacterium]|nr:ribonuclease [Phycisphaerales bacterium]
MVEKSFLVQKFAKLNLGMYTVIGYSVAGEETVTQIPELNVCFDIGRAPYFALTSDIVCVTHGHMD